MDDASLLRAFEDATLPHASWRHREHVKVGYLHLCRDPFDLALPRMRAGIRRLNAAHGVVDTPKRGYHETMTHAWLRLVDAAKRADGPFDNADAFVAAHAELMQPTLLRLFYTRDRLWSPEARIRFVEPDLDPLKAAPTRE
ncbi:MAG: hypothetical protein U0572_02920 [Phycisphaerales bacterium]